MKALSRRRPRFAAEPDGGPHPQGGVAPSGGNPQPQASEVRLPIGSLARQAGISTRTVRYYEEIGLLRTARRYAGGRRVFDGDALERLRFIGRLKRLGFTLEEIGELNDVFALQRSTRAMLDVLDHKLGQHLEALQVQLRELAGLGDDLRAYRDHIRRRLEALPARATGTHGSGTNRGTQDRSP